MIIYTDNYSSGWIFIILLVALLLIISLIVALYIFNKKRNDRVMLNSQYLKEINAVNKKYSFEKIDHTSEVKIFYLDTKRKFDYFDSYKFGEKYIRDNFSRYLSIVNKIDHNIKTLTEYRFELKQIKHTTDESIAKSNKMSLKSFVKRETKLAVFKDPVISFTLKIAWEYTSPAGRNYYSDYRDISYLEIKSIVSPLSLRTKPQETKVDSQSVRNGEINERPIVTKEEKIYTLDDIEEID